MQEGICSQMLRGGLQCLFPRWHVAIKSNRATKVGTAGKVGALDDHDDDHDDDGLPALLDEAKTMLEIGAYHDNIVNLQGIIAEQDGHSVTKVGLGTFFFSLKLEEKDSKEK